MENRFSCNPMILTKKVLFQYFHVKPCICISLGDNVINYIVSKYLYFSPVTIKLHDNVRQEAYAFFSEVGSNSNMEIDPCLLPYCVVTGVDKDIVHPLYRYRLE